jgi:uncharacterized protein YutE (UPF0331/DUF86 family)
MDVLEFISSIIHALVWPIIILVIIFTLKKPLTQLLLSLSKFKYNNLEMDFGQELSKLEKTLEKQSNYKEHVDNSKDTVGTKKDNESDILAIAEIHPSAAITVAWTMLEKEIVNTINRLAISPDYPPYNSALKNIKLLKESKYIDTATFEIINEFRQLRNNVSHAHDGRELITYLEAVKYYELAKKIMKNLTEIIRE